MTRLRELFSVLTIFTLICFSATAVEVSSGQLHKIEPFNSKFIESRNVHIWLPPGYDNSSAYSVLYMHDGQMLYDEKTTWNGQAWNVDEVAGKLISEGKVKPFIIVGVFNISEIRHADYFPQRPFESLDDDVQAKYLALEREPGRTLFGKNVQSDNYLKFLVNELKPFIDANYAVLSDRKNTAVMGSSMGGLISMYAISEYPEVFGSAACISTHWPGVMPGQGSRPASEAFFAYMRKNLPDPTSHRLYFDIGTATLDQFYPPLQIEVDKILAERGYSDTNLEARVFEGAAHTENAWHERLHIPSTLR